MSDKNNQRVYYATFAIRNTIVGTEYDVGWTLEAAIIVICELSLKCSLLLSVFDQ